MQAQHIKRLLVDWRFCILLIQCWIIGKKNVSQFSLASLREIFPFFRKKIVVKRQEGQTVHRVWESEVVFQSQPEKYRRQNRISSEQINSVQQELELEIKGIKEKFDRQSRELVTWIQEAKLALQNIESKAVKITVDGLEMQLSGVFLTAQFAAISPNPWNIETSSINCWLSSLTV